MEPNNKNMNSIEILYKKNQPQNIYINNLMTYNPNGRIRSSSMKIANEVDIQVKSSKIEDDEISETKEEEEGNISLDTIPLNDDKSVFDQSFNYDYKEILENIKQPQRLGSKLLKHSLADIDNMSFLSSFVQHTTNSDEIYKKLREDLYKTVTDPGKRIKFEEYIFTFLKSPLMANNKKLLNILIYANDDFFIGTVEKNKSRKGAMFYSSEDYYEGEFNGEKREGNGILIYKNGTRYEGVFKANKQNGHGKLIQMDGEVFIGEWRDGKINGNGVRYHSNGDSYSGNYVNNIRNGMGKYVFANGDYFEGEWVNGRANGKGKFVYSNGNYYEGEFSDNQITGKGTFNCANGDVYKGNFINGVIHGQGTFKSNKGETYQGDFYYGKRHGFGNYYSSDGIIVYSGYWNQDIYLGKKNSI
jgi:hypothetical protein